MNRLLVLFAALVSVATLVAVGFLSRHFGLVAGRFETGETAAGTQTVPQDEFDVRQICRNLAQSEETQVPPRVTIAAADRAPTDPIRERTAAPRSVSAGQSTPIDFVHDIRPIFVEHCYHCHGPDKQEGGLRLDQRESAFPLAISGTAPIAAGDPSHSLLLERVSASDDDSRMPLGKEPLSAGQIALLAEWTATGANWPADTRHWAFVKPQQPPLPTVVNTAWPRNPIDVFVLARLEAEGLPPAPEADKETLIRRLSLDLTGLPPLPEEVDAFVADSSPAAYEMLVERLFASPQFGEKWAIRWLDLGRYADTNGYDIDGQRSLWPYRDWLIDSLNRDLPFDQFTVEQLAGDLLPNPTSRQLAATGFMRNSAWKQDLEESRFETLVDRVNTLGTVWLGLSLGCAQCHNHKFDPITQAEYYQFYAFFDSMIDDVRDGGYHGGSFYVESPLSKGAGGTTLVMRESGQPVVTHIKIRGSFLADGDAVEPGFPAALHRARCGSRNRLALACWLIDEDNPLTARVTVNRYWESIFGTGLVRTSEDLGTRAEAPSHPELLDWLAVEFPRRGWSMKAMLRLFVTSATYRQESRAPAGLYERDPQNRLLARAARFRLDAELIRDVALSASGLLAGRIGGPSVFPQQPAGISEKLHFGRFEWIADEGDDAYRRGLYTFWKRNALYPGLALFDAPNRATLCARRTRSSTPVQALVTLNDPVYFEAAVHLGRRMLCDGGATPEARATSGFQRCVGRKPTATELRLLTDLYHNERERLDSDPSAAKDRIGNPALIDGNPDLDLFEWAAWSMVANVLLNLDESITKE
jgi:Protein of unknown function (DUF1553)/Protein of unknown function (DUF1549)/Planctomycete cytochrome C